jgi:putative DNA-invertase from lambdoid prophage Rac
LRRNLCWILRERVKAGIVHARSKGKAHGRPSTTKKFENEIVALYKKGISQSEIARKIGIGRTSVRRIISGKKV